MVAVLTQDQLPTELPLTGFDALELYVGNARQAATFYQYLLGFQLLGYRGPETGEAGRVSYYLKQGQVELILTAALSPEDPINQHVAKHGDGVKDVAFQCSDVFSAYNTAIQRGAKPHKAPVTLEDEFGQVHLASVSTYGDTHHTFIDRSQYNGLLIPGFKLYEHRTQATPVGLSHIDHVVGNVLQGQMLEMVQFYQTVFGFQVIREFSEDDICTENSALASMVVANEALNIKMPINEPADGPRKSQIEEYIDFYHSAGVQHVAIACTDLIKSITALKANGLRFINVPKTYYKPAQERVGKINHDWSELERCGILIDREQQGYLLQLFTQPLQDRPTLFFEFIERINGASGFGHGNFQALFEAIEREQALRGNLI